MFLRARDIKNSTREHYRETFRRLAAFSPALPATALDLEVFLAAQHVAPHTRDGYYRDLHAFYAWAARRLHVPDAAQDLTRTRLARPLPKVLTRTEVVALLRRTTDRRDRAIIAFALDTGARLHELAGVRRSDIDITADLDKDPHHEVRLRGSHHTPDDWRSKTGPRIVPLSQPAAALLTGIGDGDHLWISRARRTAGQPLTNTGIQTIIKRATHAALGRPIGPHTLRHTFATLYLRAGGDLESLRRILGHSDVATTLIYLHLVTADLAEKHARFTPLANWEREEVNK